MNDKASLIRAVTGAHTVFAVTNYWEHVDEGSKARETQQGKNIVDAAQEAGVQHFIFSSLLDATKLSNGALPHIYHFDSKAAVEEYARSLNIPSTFFLPGMYASNFTAGSFAIRQDEKSNAWILALPCSEEASYPLFDTVDTGKYIKAIVLNREKFLGKRLLAATDYVTGRELLDTFKKAFPEAGKTATYYQIPHEVFLATMKGHGFPDFLATEVLENMILCEKYGYFGGAALDEAHALVEDPLTTWEEHLKSAFKELK
jgi:uncharacterized protein YbjT (DUF2867 family)